MFHCPYWFPQTPILGTPYVVLMGFCAFLGAALPCPPLWGEEEEEEEEGRKKEERKRKREERKERGIREGGEREKE